MKQMLAILLLAVILLTVSACGSKEDDGSPADTSVSDTSDVTTVSASDLTDEERALFDTANDRVIYATGDGIYEAFTFDGDTIVKYELINEFASADEAQAYCDMLTANGANADSMRVIGRFVVTDATNESREAFDGYTKDEILGEYSGETEVSAPVSHTDSVVTDVQSVYETEPGYIGNGEYIAPGDRDVETNYIEPVTATPVTTAADTTDASGTKQPPRGENVLPDLEY